MSGPRRVREEWEVWNVYKQEYMASTNQIIVRAEVISCQIRNNRIMKTKKAQRFLATGKTRAAGMEDVPLQIHLRPWAARERPLYRKVTAEDASRYWLQVSLPRTNELHQRAPKWRLFVICGYYYHNHLVGEATYETYPTSRGITDPAIAAQVDTIVSCGVKKKERRSWIFCCHRE